MQEHHLAVRLVALFESLKQAVSQELAAEGLTGLTPLEISILEICAAHPGLSQRELVQTARRDKGQMTRLLRQLESAGYLQKEVDPANRRQNVLEVTPEALPYVEALRRARGRVDVMAINALGAHRCEQLLGLVEQLREVLDQGSLGQPPERG